MCHILSCYFWSVYDVFEQQRLVRGCAGRTIFCLRELVCTVLFLYAEVGKK